MNTETKVLCRLVIAESAVAKIQKYGLIPDGTYLATAIKKEILRIQEAIFARMSDKKVLRCAQTGDRFLDAVAKKCEHGAGSVPDADRDAELYYSYVLCLIVEDLQEWRWAAKLIEGGSLI